MKEKAPGAMSIPGVTPVKSSELDLQAEFGPCSMGLIKQEGKLLFIGHPGFPLPLRLCTDACRERKQSCVLGSKSQPSL